MNRVVARGRVARVPERQRSKESPRLGAPLLLGLLLAGGTLLVYGQVYRFGFLSLDDPIYVTENPIVRSGLNPHSLAWSFTTYRDANWFPLTWISLLFDAEIYGLRPAGYHVTNLLLHVANTVLVFVVLSRATNQLFRSALVAALFALHPLHVESVAWVSERKDVLSIFFGLLSLWAYVRFAKTPTRWSLAASLCFLVLSLMSKQTLVTLPFVFLLLDYWPLGRLRQATVAVAASETRARARPADPALDSASVWKRLLAEKIPFFAVSAIFSVVALVAQARGHAVRGLDAFPLSARFANATMAYAAYLAKAVFPHDLAVYYPHPGSNLSWLAVGGAAAVLLVISAAALATMRRFPFIFVGWAWYLGTLVPMIGIVQIGGQQMADRYTYFPLIGPFIAAVWLIAELVPVGVWRSRILPAGTLAVVVALATTTYVQLGYWRDGVSLFQHALEVSDNAFMHNQLGTTLMEQGAVPEALEQFEAASRLNSQWSDPQYNQGFALQKLGRLDDAVPHYRSALALNEPEPNTHNMLGGILLARRDYAEASQHFRRAIELDQRYMQAYVNLGIVWLETGDYVKAISYSQQALELEPNQVRALWTIAEALRAQGHFDESIDYWGRVLRLVPNNAEARAELSRTVEMKRRSR